MDALRKAASAFLALRRIAVAGVSRDRRQAANAVYRRLRKAGYEVVPVNPASDEVEGDRCFRTLSEIPGGVEGVLVFTPPDAASGVARECVALGIPRVWFHRSFGPGSVSEEAVRICQDAGVATIPGACPMMFLDPVDVGHRCIRWFLGVTGKLPEPSVPGDGAPA